MSKIAVCYVPALPLHSGDKEIWCMELEHALSSSQNTVTGPYTHVV